jgi:hypothetical protein
MSAPPPPGSRRKTWSRPLAEFVGKAIDPVLAKQGFGESDIITYWPQVVGERMAAVSEPIRLQWPSRGSTPSPDRAPQPATLIIRVESGFALELQHLAPLVIERVNARLGWRCVGKLAFRQGPVGQVAKRPPRPGPPDPAAVRKAAESAAPITDDGLRAALTRLGSRVFTKERAKS